MRSLWSASLILLLGASCVQAQDKPKESEYYPLQIGNTWTYKAGDGKFVLKVVKYEKIDKDMTARVEMSSDGKTLAYENVAVRDDGVYRFNFGDKKADKPVKFFELPPVKDKTWKVEVTTGANETLKGTFKIGEEDNVKVPAGTYKTFTSSSDDLDAAGLKISCTFYFAKDVGLVKQVLKVQGQEIVIELEKFESGKKVEKDKDK